MGWSVSLEDEDGLEIQGIHEEFRFDYSELNMQSSFRLLKYLDPHGDTTFNKWMMDDVIADLVDLEKLQPNTSRLVYYITEMAKKCKGANHTYLKFYGD